MKNSDTPGIIHHEGIVQENSGKSVLVTITPSTACSGCHAKGSCNVTGGEKKIISVDGSYDVKPGDSVVVQMKESMGYTALILGYILPFVSVMATLIILIAIGFSELTAGLISLAILLPYYMILFLFRKRVNEKFTFTLKV
jgi:sigma-E factor negative regulatory protein RseC